MKSLIRLEDLDPADFIIKWRMTEMCNINCSYCIRQHGNAKKIDKELLKKQEVRLHEVAGCISNFLNKTELSNVKIDLIGGEVTLFDLSKILFNLNTDKIKKIQITTNLTQPVSYFKNLVNILSEKGIGLSMTASCHYEFQSLNAYFDKIKVLQEFVSPLTCEMVSHSGNQDLCKEFKVRCEDIGVNYMLEADLRDKSLSARERGLMVASKKPSAGPRYKAKFSDGTEETYVTRNSFLYDKSIKENSEQKWIATEGYFCTNSAGFVYIDFDTAVGRTDKNDSCTNRMPIEEFTITSPRRCPHKHCSLCGHMSLWK